MHGLILFAILAGTTGNWTHAVTPSEAVFIHEDGTVEYVPIYSVTATEAGCGTYAFNAPREGYAFQGVRHDLAMIMDSGIVYRLGSCREWTWLFVDDFETGGLKAWSAAQGAR